jgi:hypothetical protein
MKKHQQLGMNAGTAAHRLLKDILFKLVTDAGHVCHRCGGVLAREDFSIEHVKPWLDSVNPAKLYFDLENIAFSHKACNYGAARRPNQVCADEAERKQHAVDVERHRYQALPKEQRQAIRRRKYESSKLRKNQEDCLY